MMNITNRFVPCCLLLAIVTVTAGCNGRDASEPPRDLPDICKADCNFTVTLPDAVDQLPQVPDVIRVSGGTEVNFRLPGGGEKGFERTNGVGQAPDRTVLSFEEPAFVDDQENPVYTLELTAGDNRYTARSHEANVCHAPDGCRYVVINVGHPGRPSIISSPHFIIAR